MKIIRKKNWIINISELDNVVARNYIFQDILFKKYIKSSNSYDIPINPITLNNIKYLITNYKDIKYDNNFIKTLDNFNKRFNIIKNKGNSIYLDKDIEIEGLKIPLRPFQKVSIKYLSMMKKGILSDEMGLGKTIQLISLFLYNKCKKCLIVCPNSLKLNWKKEIEKFTNKTVNIVDDKTLDIISDFNIINYEKLCKDKFAEYLVNLKQDMIVFDESHNLKNEKSNKSKISELLSKETEYVYLLSGTPIVNKPKELINQLKILGYLDIFCDWWSYTSRYCGLERTKYGFKYDKAYNITELNNILKSTCMIRRLKKDVLTDLPPKQFSYIPLEFEDKYKKQYNMYLDALKGKFNEEKNRKNFTLSEVSRLRQVVVKAKLDGFIEWVENFLETDNKLVIFGWHLDSIEEICKKFKCNKITGEVSIEDRQKYVEDFQNNPKTKLIVCNIKAAGTGLTLTSASSLAFIEFAWTPGDMEQAEDRIHRMGQLKQADIYYFYIPDTIDEVFIDMLQEKNEILMGVLDGYSKESLMNNEDKDLLTMKEKMLKYILKGNNEDGKN